jgi:CDP-diacylglycerol--glycerol-3-phosphate 3-phosphatidyltransferase
MDYAGFRGHLWAIFLTLFLIALDGLDGIVARWLKEASDIGGVFDIVVDRIVENCFWIYFAARGAISVWLPFIVLTRGLLTDEIRSVAFSKGLTAFGEKTLQKSVIGKALVSSRWSRGLYGLSKALAFFSLIFIQGLGMPGSELLIGKNAQHVMIVSGYTIIYVTVGFCILRGIPVFVDGFSLLFPKRDGR